MHKFAGWQRWIIVLFSLPAGVVISTFIVSQTQIGQLIPADLPFQHTIWTALQLSLASGLIWLFWRNTSHTRDWHAIGASMIEGFGLFGIAIGIGWYFALIDITWQMTAESVVAMIGLAIPLAWWSMAEERMLRTEVSTLLPRTPTLIRDIVMLGIGWVVQVSLISTHSIFVLLIILLTEGLSVMTWSGSANFERTWARRWAWRWLIVIGAGISSTGFLTATPSLIVVTTDDPLALVVLVAAPLAAWISYSAMQTYATE